MPETHKQKGKWQLSGLKHCWSYVKKISARIQDWGTHCKFVCNNYNSMLSVRKKCTLLPLKHYIYIYFYVLYICASLSCLYLSNLRRYFSMDLSYYCTCCTHVTVFCSNLFFFFSKDVYIENIIKDELSLLSKGHACSNPWKRVSPSGAMSRVAYCPL